MFNDPVLGDLHDDALLAEQQRLGWKRPIWTHPNNPAISMYIAPVGHYPANPLGAVVGLASSDQAWDEFTAVMDAPGRTNAERFKRACVSGIYDGDMRDNLLQWLDMAIGIESNSRYGDIFQKAFLPIRLIMTIRSGCLRKL